MTGEGILTIEYNINIPSNDLLKQHSSAGRETRTKGHTGRIVLTQLSDASINEEDLPQKRYREFMGGYGITTAIL